MTSARCALVLVAACGDNLRVARDAPSSRDVRTSDTQPGQPDLTLVAAEMDGTLLITNDTFAATDCEIVEGCVNAVGTRRLLRFDTVTANVGTADLVLGQVPPPGVSEGIFVWSPCHMHHHVAGYASYELRDGANVVATGHKQGFCISDTEQIDPRSGPSDGYTCMIQGITPGWADVYDRSVACQWVDITDVPSGSYTLHVVINATGALADSNPANDDWTATVTL